MRTITVVTEPEEKPGRLQLAIMAWQRQLVKQQNAA